jgi:hypothetical protein
MAGTIYSGTYLNGIVLGNPSTQRPATVTGRVSNKNADAIYGKPVARWTVANEGTIASTGSAGYGIGLAARGTVENGASGAGAALISGYGGVLIDGALATVSNLGTIEGTGGNRDGVELEHGGLVTNGNAGTTAAQISGGRHAVVIRNAAGTVRNFGTLTSTGTYNTVDLFAGGALTNGSAASKKALISGGTSVTGVDINGGAGTVANFGTIAAGWGVALRAGGWVTNGSTAATDALISGARKGVSISGAAGTVTNFATITASGDLGVAVSLRAGGSVTNGNAGSTKALISGGGIEGSGVHVTSGTGTVTNFATIGGGSEFGAAVYLGAGGRVTNGSNTSTTALIKDREDGILIARAAGTVTNFGRISGAFLPISLDAGGRVTNGSASSTAAYIGGVYGVDIRGGAGTVTNFGTIQQKSASRFGSGVGLIAGGTLTNGSASSTTAYIGATGYGVILNGAGIVKNFGTIVGSREGINTYGAHNTIINFGKIANAAGAAAVAVRMDSLAGNKLVVEPGAVFVGSVLGGGNSRIDFETAGAAAMSDVSGFKTITLGNGKSHTLTLTSANFAAVTEKAITVDDGDFGNTVTATTLPGGDHIIVHAGVGLDTLTGGKGNDVFYADGDTVMTGGAGRNKFVFSAPGGNTVGDFAVSASNEVVFSNKGFSLGLSGASGTPKALPADLFVENSDGHFTATSQRFAYATGDRDLFYSASGDNGTPALVSHFSNTPALTAARLFFIT